jgi:hypothetical protein
MELRHGRNANLQRLVEYHVHSKSRSNARSASANSSALPNRPAARRAKHFSQNAFGNDVVPASAAHSSPGGLGQSSLADSLLRQAAARSIRHHVGLLSRDIDGLVGRCRRRIYTKPHRVLLIRRGADEHALVEVQGEGTGVIDRLAN